MEYMPFVLLLKNPSQYFPETTIFEFDDSHKKYTPDGLIDFFIATAYKVKNKTALILQSLTIYHDSLIKLKFYDKHSNLLNNKLRLGIYYKIIDKKADLKEAVLMIFKETIVLSLYTPGFDDHLYSNLMNAILDNNYLNYFESSLLKATKDPAFLLNS